MTTKIGFQQELPEEVVEQAKRGDMKAFEQIYRTYANACYSVALRICDQTTMAQDVMQESFVKVMRRIESFRGDGRFASWLKQIVIHETINRIRSNNRIHLVGEDELLKSESKDLFNQSWLDVCRDLDSFLSRLSTTARAVLLLHEVEGYSHREIANLFGKSESFSKITLFRAYAALKQLAEKQQERQNALK
ncbi:RNA polymerase sigma factor [Aliikangiella coralliicola]|uniref:RNA polymerase sigma factor n=1 Tax=Aliikangiella coralliicola TaxID=2592383 RepID=A0A545UAQ5_9GAMM|nr:RNA polymerase sigma factor [Aliikangiella coralliicola]TQV86551.1 RNA polymerase sigma factor [Aliikangiella coralliicola]